MRLRRRFMMLFSFDVWRCESWITFTRSQCVPGSIAGSYHCHNKWAWLTQVHDACLVDDVLIVSHLPGGPLGLLVHGTSELLGRVRRRGVILALDDPLLIHFQLHNLVSNRFLFLNHAEHSERHKLIVIRCTGLLTGCHVVVSLFTRTKTFVAEIRRRQREFRATQKSKCSLRACRFAEGVDFDHLHGGQRLILFTHRRGGADVGLGTRPLVIRVNFGIGPLRLSTAD
ncbi:hypothetical protein [Planctomicrobium sp. SH527]|uniref:hypothetical protein n=1 Tax=Planctomicrobium sp. SH527 TaxID=3448123 RepID=UPI003F5BE063